MKKQYIKDCCLKYEYKLLNTIDNAIDKPLYALSDFGLEVNIIISRFWLNTLGARKRHIETPSNYDSDYHYVTDENKAIDYMCNNKKVPMQLAKKLIEARKQLERRGVFGRYKNFELDSDFKSMKLQHYGINEQKELTGYILEYDYFNKSVPGNYKSLEDFENDITEAKRKIQCGEKVSKKKWDKLKHAYREIKFTKRDESEQ